ncbi:MAG: helix-turn-helix domain-containing protein [Parasutterella excrementihominis]
MTRRLGLAENLLKENKLSIKQISYSVGFKTPAHFSTAFKKRHEMTPSEYRASNTGCN